MVVSFLSTMSSISLQTEGERVSGPLSLPVQVVVFPLHGRQAGARVTV